MYTSSDADAAAAATVVTLYCSIQQIKECEFQSDGRCYIAAKLVSRCRISEHFVEDATQGLHYCQVRPLKISTLGLYTELFVKQQFLHPLRTRMCKAVYVSVCVRVLITALCCC
jgi:hypothetical protein